MMMKRPVAREDVAVALFAKLQTVPGFTTTGRKHVIPAPEQQPALFQVGVKNLLKPEHRGLPAKLAISFYLFVYAYDTGGDEPLGEETDLVETKMNTLIDGIEDALSPDEATGFQTLGDLVSHCWIE